MMAKRLAGAFFGAIASALPAAAVSTAAAGIAALAFSLDAAAVDCGAYNGHVCNGAPFQYGGGFSPHAGEYGGFGGAADCIIARTPVVFVHGNADNATSWDAPPFKVADYAKPPYSVYRQLRAAGYQDCELFGVTYLSASERARPGTVFQHPPKYAIVDKFINAVMRYTGSPKVDIVAHSLGVSTSMAALAYHGHWNSVRRFVNIAGALRGLDSCLWAVYTGSYWATCGSQNLYYQWVFGLYPDAAAPGINRWTGTSAPYALSNSADANPGVAFYTIYAGTHDEVMCTTTSRQAACGRSPLLRNTHRNVKAQLNVGAGSNAAQLDWNWRDGMPWNVAGGDMDGVGHFHARSNTGKIILNMLTTPCSATGCASGYAYGPYQAP